METTDITLQWVKDRADITDTILRFFYAIDTHNWNLLRSCLAETLDVDYAMRGESRRITFADEFVEQRCKELSHLQMQHINTNHLITINGNEAECTSCFLIHHLDPTQPLGENAFHITGHYKHDLIQTASGWLINYIKQTVIWSNGNPKIHGAFRRT